MHGRLNSHNSPNGLQGDILNSLKDVWEAVHVRLEVSESGLKWVQGHITDCKLAYETRDICQVMQWAALASQVIRHTSSVYTNGGTCVQSNNHSLNVLRHSTTVLMAQDNVI